jgi:hypothetical protein
MLATDETTTESPEPNPPQPVQPVHLPVHLEIWAENERMRHIPSMSWIVEKLEHDLRGRIDHLLSSYANLAHDDPHHAPIEHELRLLCKSIDRLGDLARRPRGQNHPPTDLGNRIGWSISHAVQSLHAADHDTFGRRFPFQTLDRSFAEPLRAALLTVIVHVQRLQELVRKVDPRIDVRLYEGLVVLSEPLRREPIA